MRWGEFIRIFARTLYPVMRLCRAFGPVGLLSAAVAALPSTLIAAQPGGSGGPSALTATEPASNPATFDMKFEVALESDYNYRGYTLSNHQPSLSGTFEATYGISYVGVDLDSVKIPRESNLQMTDSAGIRPVLGALTIDVGAQYFSYPGHDDAVIDYPEYYVLPSYTVTPHLTLGLNIYYAPDYDRSGAWENYVSATASYTFESGLSLSGELGRQSFGTTRATADSPSITLPKYLYWSLGFSYTYKVLTFDVHYYATNLSRQKCFLITGTGQPNTGSNDCDPAIIAKLSLNSSLSALKALRDMPK